MDLESNPKLKEALEQDEYRVGCWNGEVSDGQAILRHDSMDEDVVVDVNELHDIANLTTILILKDIIVRGNRDDVENFAELVNDLEA